MKNNQPSTDDVTRIPDRAQWWFPLLLLAMVAGMVCLAVAGRSNRPQGAAAVHGSVSSPTPLPAGQTVRLEIDFGNGTIKNFAALPWQKGMTVADLMGVARGFHPGAESQQRGEGAGAFLDSIDGIAPQATGDRGWKYRVNGQFGEVSIGIQPLQPGDHVLWSIEAVR